MKNTLLLLTLLPLFFLCLTSCDSSKEQDETENEETNAIPEEKEATAEAEEEEAILDTSAPSAEYSMKIGKGYAEEGNLGMALIYYTDAIKLDSNYAEAYLYRGGVHYATGDLTAAISDYTEAIRINPNNGDAYAIRGYSQMMQEELLSACDDFNRSCELGYEIGCGWYNTYCKE